MLTARRKRRHKSSGRPIGLLHPPVSSFIFRVMTIRASLTRQERFKQGGLCAEGASDDTGSAASLMDKTTSESYLSLRNGLQRKRPDEPASPVPWTCPEQWDCALDPGPEARAGALAPVSAQAEGVGGGHPHRLGGKTEDGRPSEHRSQPAVVWRAAPPPVGAEVRRDPPDPPQGDLPGRSGL